MKYFPLVTTSQYGRSRLYHDNNTCYQLVCKIFTVFRVYKVDVLKVIACITDTLRIQMVSLYVMTKEKTPLIKRVILVCTVLQDCNYIVRAMNYLVPVPVPYVSTKILPA